MRALVSARRGTVLPVAIGVLLLTAGGAQADPETAAPGPHLLPPVSAPPPARRSWLRSELSRVHIHKKTGLAYTRQLERDGADLELSVRGPGLGRKRLGLSIELRF